MLSDIFFKLGLSSILAAGLLVGCQDGMTFPSSMVSLPETFADLEAEYASFSTQALTQNYLERKVKHWVVQNNGEAMRREVEFARRKHPALLSNILTNNALCNQVGAFPEVVAYKSTNPDFGDYVSNIACPAPAFVGEFQVMTLTEPNNFLSPAQAINDNGRFIIAWPAINGIFAQRFATDGRPIGSEFQVSNQTGLKILPSIAMDNSGGFVISWTSRNGQDGSYDGIFARRFAANGSPIGNEFQVNTYTNGFQQVGHMAMDDNGNFVITWQSEGQDGSGYGVHAQRFAANGSPIGNEFQVNTYTENRQITPSIAMSNSGEFVITWQSDGQDGSDYGVYAQRFTANGIPIGSEFQVNTYTENIQEHPVIAMDNNGNFVISWSSLQQDGEGYGVFAQRFAANGSPLGNEFQINTNSESDQRYASIAMDDSGSFVVNWTSVQQDGAVGNIFARRFAANGSPIGNEFQVNTTHNGQVRGPLKSLAMNAHGDFIISWARFVGNILTGPAVYEAAFAQRYNAQGEAQ